MEHQAPQHDLKENHREGQTWGARAGFTILELVISLAIIAVLISLIIPAIRATVVSARSFKCQMAQRSVAFSFSVFADESMGVDRGRGETATQTFTLLNFIDSQYQIAEFWGYPGQAQVEMPDANGNDPLRCPNVQGPISLVDGPRCTDGGVVPASRISYGFNMRLQYAEAPSDGTESYYKIVRLNSGILGQQMTPLLWDVDGAAAEAVGVSPVLSSPGLGPGTMYSDNRYWFPANRHGGKANYTFVDGHVEETATPLQQADWQWHFVPSLREP